MGRRRVRLDAGPLERFPRLREAAPRDAGDRRGDCEDFALVAISWALANDRDGVGIGFCFEPWMPVPTHVIAYDDTHVYSSGNVEPESVDEWLEDAKYRYVLRRRVRA